ncbi:MAG: cysteine desulfurase [Gammaproteobacteria bacterium]|nr:cysteine desulfurase [Gammaproteobacteria bacterium]|tara:strand:- start:380 stop:1621 length:1242 start_codon:yes stop_codon:yes gene_type:complete
MNINNGIDIASIKKDFPALQREVHAGVPLVYLDTTATSQKPTAVLNSLNRYYSYHNANVHRGIHTLAEEATAAYEDSRKCIASFLGATSEKEVIFLRNTTEAINLVAHAWGRSKLVSGDRVILSEMEHHSNLVPWHILSETLGVQIDIINVDAEGYLDMDHYVSLLNDSPKLVSVTHMSNVLGTVNPIKTISTLAHDAGAIVMVDAAQSVPHMKVDVNEIGADFVAFSAHKMCGPTGIGVLWGRRDILEDMPPFLGGGDMIKRVYLRSFAPNDLPYKFEAGTPAIGEAIGFGEAVRYLDDIGMDKIWDHEQKLVKYAMEKVSQVAGVTIYGPSNSQDRGGVVAFTLDGVHPHDIAQVLDSDGVAVRAGHHCAMPLHEKYSLMATTRASFYIYNDFDDVDALVESLDKVSHMFK